MSSVGASVHFDRHGNLTLLDYYSLRLQLEHLWNADKCPALSREQRVERIRDLSVGFAE